MDAFNQYNCQGFFQSSYVSMKCFNQHISQWIFLINISLNGIFYSFYLSMECFKVVATAPVRPTAAVARVLGCELAFLGRPAVSYGSINVHSSATSCLS
jgi:hypothetical protein